MLSHLRAAITLLVAAALLAAVLGPAPAVAGVAHRGQMRNVTTRPIAAASTRYIGRVTNRAVAMEFACDREPAFCRNAERALENVGRRLESVLDIAVPIKINVTLFLPCNETRYDPASSCKMMNTLGYATPTRYYPVWVPEAKDDGSPAMPSDGDSGGMLIDYPQPLLRQLQVQQGLSLEGLQLAEFDVTARFNSLFDWYFSGTPVTPPGSAPAAPATPAAAGNRTAQQPPAIGPDQYDFELVCLHELLHGLGWGTVNLVGAVENQMLVPVPETTDGGTTFLGFRPPTVYQARLAEVDRELLISMSESSRAAAYAGLVPRDDALSSFTTAINATVVKSARPPAALDRVNRILANGKAAEPALRLYELATSPDAVVFASPALGKAVGSSPRGKPPVVQDAPLAGTGSGTAASADAAAATTGTGAAAAGTGGLTVIAADTTTSSTIWIESSLAPYEAGSSLDHVSYRRHGDTAEFLMIYSLPHGTTLAQLVAKTAAPWTGIGSKTLDALRALGYRLLPSAPGLMDPMLTQPPPLGAGAFAINLPSQPLVEQHPTPVAASSAPAGGGKSLWNAAPVKRTTSWGLAAAAALFFGFGLAAA
ncbi:hypothetical protein H9P43_001350 [Blastocladiella emersonii ATCC 22665]|nr:hypothetical protein H9P43_001350 [Blastocladiella emersonii ATCC 22665]